MPLPHPNKKNANQEMTPIVHSTEDKAIKGLDHLGIVAGVCDEIGLVSHINMVIPSAGQRKVSFGIGLKAMILNGLGFTQRPLYLTPEFFKDKPVSHLLGKEVKANDLHDDCLGDTLDAIYEYGVSKLFFELSYRSLQHYNIKVLSKHLDGTSLSVHGKGSDKEAGAVRIVRGYNKQGRHNLRQVVLELVSSNTSGIPLFMSVHNGNEVDKVAFPKVIASYKAELLAQGLEEDHGLWVADNALYTDENIGKLSKVNWLSRAGHRLNWVKRAYQKSEGVAWKDFEEHSNYQYQLIKTDYGGVAQAALVIRSQQKYAKDVHQFEKKLSKNYVAYEKVMKGLGRKEFKTRESAKEAAESLSVKDTYHQAEEVKIEKVGHYKRGRRKADAKPIRYTYKVAPSLIVEKTAEIEQARAVLGKFVLVTNELNKKEQGDKLLKRSADELLTLYKNEQQQVERGFRFIKDPQFMLSYIFLQLPHRIVALCMVMCLCLLIYCLAEWKLRKTMAEVGAKLPNQLGKQISNPTMRWIFFQFQGLNLEYRQGQDYAQLIGLTDLHRKILQLLGGAVSSYYGV